MSPAHRKAASSADIAPHAAAIFLSYISTLGASALRARGVLASWLAFLYVTAISKPSPQNTTQQAHADRLIGPPKTETCNNHHRVDRAFCGGCLDKLGEGTAAKVEALETWVCPCCDVCPLAPLQVILLSPHLGMYRPLLLFKIGRRVMCGYRVSYRCSWKNTPRSGDRTNLAKKRAEGQGQPDFCCVSRIFGRGRPTRVRKSRLILSTPTHPPLPERSMPVRVPDGYCMMSWMPHVCCCFFSVPTRLS